VKTPPPPDLHVAHTADVSDRLLDTVAQRLRLIEKNLTAPRQHVLQRRESSARLLLRPWHPHPLPRSRNKSSALSMRDASIQQADRRKAISRRAEHASSRRSRDDFRARRDERIARRAWDSRVPRRDGDRMGDRQRLWRGLTRRNSHPNGFPAASNGNACAPMPRAPGRLSTQPPQPFPRRHRVAETAGSGRFHGRVSSTDSLYERRVIERAAGRPLVLMPSRASVRGFSTDPQVIHRLGDAPESRARSRRARPSRGVRPPVASPSSLRSSATGWPCGPCGRRP